MIFFWNFIYSLLKGKPAGKNPWQSNTLEWTTESPPPHGNWPADQLPTVYRGPYEYSHPDRKEDYWPQNASEPEGDPMSARPIATTRSAAGLPTGRLAVWWVIVSEIVIFGGLLGSYIMHRLAHDAFAAQAAHTNTWIGAFNTLVLLSSSLSAVLAHKAAERGDGKRAAQPAVCDDRRRAARSWS